MKKVTMKIAVGLAMASVLAFTPAQAEENKKRDADYQRILLIDFKPGHKGAAMKIIKNYFQKASMKVGSTMPITHHMMTGPWDMMLVWPMKHGMASTEWTSTAEGKKWNAAMAELAGGKEKAAAKWKEYQSHIARSSSAFSYTMK